METPVIIATPLNELPLPTPSSTSQPAETTTNELVSRSPDGDESMDTDILKQRLESISKKREELQQMEIELRAQIIARTEITPKPSKFDSQVAEHDNAGSEKQTMDNDESATNLQQQTAVPLRRSKRKRGDNQSATSPPLQSLAPRRRKKRLRGTDESTTNLQQLCGDPQIQDKQAKGNVESSTDLQQSVVLHNQDKKVRGEESARDFQQSVVLHNQDKLVVSESPGVLESSEKVDLTDTFTTDTVFNGREELIKWVRDTGKSVGIVVVVLKSDFSEGRKTHRIIFGCERGGQYLGAKRKKGTPAPVRKKITKKCGCPFVLRGVKLKNEDKWTVRVVCGFHNHLTHNYETHSYVGRLTPEEKATLIEMANSGVKPKEILTVLKERDIHNASTMSTIYNARSKLKVGRVCGKSQMQLMLKRLAEKEYVECHRIKENTDIVSDVFWAHQESIQLAKCFPHVFLLDCTYKINRFRMPLVEIVGVTSTNKTFSFAFVYLEAEKEENIVWALECMKSTLDLNTLPSVLVTDSNVALLDAIKKVFPNARNLLCRHHISRNIQSNCKRLFETNEVWKKFQLRWNDLVSSATVEEYSHHLSAIETDFSQYSGAISYATDFWLSKHKECFVAAWTDSSIHLGNTTANRAEGAHAKLKRYLGSSQGNFDTWWSTINYLLLLQQTEINASLEKTVETMISYKLEVLQELRGYVSKVALDIILTEVVKADVAGVDHQEDCGCLIRRTHGLPCSHEIVLYKREGRAIPLSCIHPHWKTLSSLPTLTQLNHLDCKPEIEMFVKRFEESDEKSRVILLKRLMEIAA